MDKKEHEKFKKQLKKFHDLEHKCLQDIIKGHGKRLLMRTSDGMCGCYQTEHIGETIRLGVYRTCTFMDMSRIKSYDQNNKRYYCYKCNYQSKITKALIKKYKERKNNKEDNK